MKHVRPIDAALKLCEQYWKVLCAAHKPSPITCKVAKHKAQSKIVSVLFGISKVEDITASDHTAFANKLLQTVETHPQLLLDVQYRITDRGTITVRRLTPNVEFPSLIMRYINHIHNIDIAQHLPLRTMDDLLAVDSLFKVYAEYKRLVKSTRLLSKFTQHHEIQQLINEATRQYQSRKAREQEAARAREQKRLSRAAVRANEPKFNITIPQSMFFKFLQSLDMRNKATDLSELNCDFSTLTEDQLRELFTTKPSLVKLPNVPERAQLFAVTKSSKAYSWIKNPSSKITASHKLRWKV